MAIRPPGEFHLKFLIWLEDFLMSGFEPEAGCVAFHRWLPNGENDALVLPIQWRGGLKIWFDRLGYPDEHGFIRYDRKRRELTDDVIRRNAVAFSGPLLGRLTLQQIDRDDLDRVRKGTNLYEEHQKSGESLKEVDFYEEFGKRVAKLLAPPLARFFKLIRHNYGQYWVRDFRANVEPAYFFNVVRAEWFDEETNTWRRFRPTIGRLDLVVSQPRWDQFLTQEDWSALADVLKREREPDPAMEILSRANRFLDEEDVATSLVESITSLEMAIERFVANRLRRSEVSEFAEFNDYRIGPKLKIVLTVLDPPIDPQDAARALEAIKQRNAFVHDGLFPPDSAKANVRSVLGITARLLGPPSPKLPHRPLGSRSLYPPETR
jgi:hypothetical protein